MQSEIEPLTPEQEAPIRARLAANPFIRFVGIQVPQLGRGYARFLLPFKPELANAIGLLQGGMIAALADEAVAYALYSLVAPGETINTVEMKINFLAAVK
ncbi:MAG: PaaI family thioesterase, partial [Desulfobaccales bacterium]